ncbi:CsbD family protein [Shimia ponticola]|uniref:CsbD family protein n=1 Tax=Shimia ponticola TaxID=2582893 RepID=UPI0011BF867E|nr:CsbD family protein [Shimia ponticola]
MNWERIKGNWNEWTGKARQEWGELTEDELEKTKGERDEVIGLIQQKYGVAKDEAEKKVDAFFDKAA